jgi:predicted phage tail protein
MDQPNPGKIDIEYIIGEIARRHKIVFRPTDAAFAIVTINELVLKNTLQEAMKAMAATLDRFDTSIERAENRAGRILGQQVKDAVQQFRQAAQPEVVSGAGRVQDRAALRFWAGIGLIGAALLLAASFWLGWLLGRR